MILSGGRYYEIGLGFVTADISYDPSTGLIDDSFHGEKIDISGCIVLPGFVDTHIHGCFGSDTSDLTSDSIVNMALNLPRFGVTSFCPTTMTMSCDKIYKAFDSVAEAITKLSSMNRPYARILGVHLEGPFLSPQMSGVQGREDLILPKDGFEIIDKIENDHPGLLKIIDIAPELEGSEEFIQRYKDRYVLSIAHSMCDYDLAVRSISSGIKSVTHVLNAMVSIDKRAPGVACAAFDTGSYVEVICDGTHIMPPVLRVIFKSAGKDRTIVISDSMRGAGMPDGEYLLGDTLVKCENGRTYFGEDKRLAGSVSNLFDEYLLLKDSGIEHDQIVRSLTINPLNRIGSKNGEIRPGQMADLVVIKDDKVYMSICGGRILINSF